MLSLRHQIKLLLTLAILLDQTTCNLVDHRQHVMNKNHPNYKSPPKAYSNPSVEVLSTIPGPGKVQIYPEPGTCSSSSTLTTNINTYRADECQNLNPHEISQIQIASPAICRNGTRALFTVFASSNCWFSASETTQVSDEVVGRCIDASQVWSCAFICEGLPEGSGGVGKLLAAVAVVGGLAVIGFGVLAGVFFCGGGMIFFALVGLLLWGFWILVGLMKVSFISAANLDVWY